MRLTTCRIIRPPATPSGKAWATTASTSISAGHEHIYNRAEVAINGGPEIQQIVFRTGGAPLSSGDGTYNDNRVILESHQEPNYGYTLVTVNGNNITVVFYTYDDVSTWTPFDTYTYTLTSRNFGANDANHPSTRYPDQLLSGHRLGFSLKIGQGTLTLNAGTSTYCQHHYGVCRRAQGPRGLFQRPVTVQSGGAANLADAG